ncbi:MAG: glycerophosphodiester phosphodiesterase [Oscillospiraceae bacterium]|nr:glycerophosphodiester phosphodiesterase [Oscillospiraceae bacterium]
MKTLTKLALGAGCLLALPPLLLAPGRAPKAKRAPFAGRNFAHRGLYTADQQVPENSLAAFRLAAEAGYGMELDVQLSRDGEVLVFHDETLDRICFVPGRVDGLDSAVLRRLPLCGTGETLPRLADVLELVAGRTPLIVELKPGQRRRELCEKTLAALRRYGGPVCVESFDPRIVAWFRFHAPELLRGQLAQPPAVYRAAGMGPVESFLLGHTLCNLIARPEFIAYRIGPRPRSVRFAELLGAMRVGWTAHSPAAERGRDAVIFEFYRPAPRYRSHTKQEEQV